MILLKPLQPLIPIDRHLIRVEDMGDRRQAGIIHHTHRRRSKVSQFRIPERKTLEPPKEKVS
jgi:hypothetical protein